MSCTQSRTLHDVFPAADVTTSLLDLDIDTTCSLTKSLCFDSIDSIAMSSNTSNPSEMTPWQSAEYCGAVSNIDMNTTFSSSGVRQTEMQGSDSVSTNLWRQASTAAMVTPGHASSNYQLANSVSNLYWNAPHGFPRSMKFENPEPAAWPSNVTPASPAMGGVNASSCIPYQHLNSCYAYALDRGNGLYTQLIPADCLPPSLGLPSLQGPDGLIILSPPRGPAPSHAVYNPAPSAIGTGRSASRASDAVQNTIDHIVASLPPAPKKREKIYCDKWLHEGVCAFAQQGCRYKHEMPMDKATQHAVGLFNGLPKWYKERYAAELRGRSPSSSTARSQSSPQRGRNVPVSVGSWRGEHSGGRGGMLPASRNVYKSRSAGSSAVQGAYSAEGNGRPSSGVSSTDFSNPYDLLFEQGEAEIDDGEV